MSGLNGEAARTMAWKRHGREDLLPVTPSVQQLPGLVKVAPTISEQWPKTAVASSALLGCQISETCIIAMSVPSLPRKQISFPDFNGPNFN